MVVMGLIEESSTNYILWTIIYYRQQAYGNDHGLHYNNWMLQEINQAIFLSRTTIIITVVIDTTNIFLLASFPSFIFLESLFSWLFALISFNFHLHVVLLLPSLFFFLSMFLWSIPLFFTLSGCAYHWSSTITRFRG